MSRGPRRRGLKIPCLQGLGSTPAASSNSFIDKDLRDPSLRLLMHRSCRPSCQVPLDKRRLPFIECTVPGQPCECWEFANYVPVWRRSRMRSIKRTALVGVLVVFAAGIYFWGQPDGRAGRVQPAYRDPACFLAVPQVKHETWRPETEKWKGVASR